MKNYKDYILKKGDQELGIPWSDIQEHLLTPAEYERFSAAGNPRIRGSDHLFH